MKVPVFYVYPYAQLQEAEFSIRLDGICSNFCCKKLKGHKKRIRTARALLVREKVITAQLEQYWKLNKKRTHWTFYAPYRVASIPSHEVYWALSSGDCDDADVETYERKKITRWRIIKHESFCRFCDVPGVVKPNGTPYICNKCHARMENMKEKLSAVDFSVLVHPEKFSAFTRQDRSHNLRWLRKFVAAGSFTPSEFKALCIQHGNVCLRCRKSDYWLLTM
jgi:hypothetical protein